jgi:phage terminase large subunit-like protein
VFSWPDGRGNLYSARQRPEQKIDAAVALMMAAGRAMADDDGQDLSFLSEPVIAA